MSAITHAPHHEPLDVTARGFEESLGRLRLPAMAALGVGLLLLIVGLLVAGPKQFYQSYLYAYLFWLGLPLGCMSLLMLQHMTGGTWGLTIRRILEAGTRVLPLMALLFIPVVLGIHYLYPWADHHYHARGFKHDWLQVNGFIIRAIIYFVAWLIFVFLLNRWSADQDRTGDELISRRLQLISGPGLVVYVLCMTGAAVDWVMSLDPDWYSTMFGLLFVVGQALSTLAMAVLIVTLVRERLPMSGLLSVNIFHDLGNLLMAFTMLWAYLNFSQFLIIWSGNIAEETPYYIYRTRRGWKYVALLLVLFHFAVPFILLLWRKTKQTVTWLTAVAGGLLVMRLVDLKWMTGPSFQRPLTHGSIDPHNLPHFPIGSIWVDLGAVLAIGGLWLLVFTWQLKRRPILPVNDPRLPAALAAAHAH